MVSHPNAWFFLQIFLSTHIILFHTRGNSPPVTATDTISGSLYLPNIKWLTHIDIRNMPPGHFMVFGDYKACVLTHSLWQNRNENEMDVPGTVLLSFFLLRNFFLHMHVHSCVAINFWTETGQYIANDNSEAPGSQTTGINTLIMHLKTITAGTRDKMLPLAAGMYRRGLWLVAIREHTKMHS